MHLKKEKKPKYPSDREKGLLIAYKFTQYSIGNNTNKKFFVLNFVMLEITESDLQKPLLAEKEG